MAQGHHLHLRLFLEGIEVPVISAQVQVTANAPASASIQVIATDKVLSLLPRTVVHLFFFDYVEAGNQDFHTDQELVDEDFYYPTPDDEDRRNSKYKLLFMGELFAIEFQKTSFSRAVVLQCSDFSNYWDTTFQYNFGGSLFGGRREAAFIGANSNFFTSPLGHGVGTISALLNSKSANFPKLTGLMAGVVRMLEAIGGSYYGKNTFRGCNDFTSIAELRLKILQQITAAEKDTSTSKLFARKAFNMWMNRQSGSLGKLVSFRGLVKLMFDFIFHEVYPCPAAMFVPATTKENTLPTSVPLSQSNAYKGFIAQVSVVYDKVEGAYARLQEWHGCITDSDLTQGEVQYFRAHAGAEKAVKALYILGNMMPRSSSLGLQKQLSEINSNVQKIKVNQVDMGLHWVKDASWYTKITGFYDTMLAAFKKILGLRMKGSKKVQVPMPARVNNQIFRPDVFYSPPPRCNVLFPETYDQFTFSRQYMREVSRMELQTHNELLGNDALFNGRYYAPDIEDVRRGVRLSSLQFAKVIMEHELYTGIVPMFENMSEANIFSMASGKSIKEGEKVGFAQRAVNFQYFKYRFQARSMDASGRFNPGFAPGFPALIIDKPMDSASLSISAMPIEDQLKALNLKVDPNDKITRAELLQDLVSPQYLGVCAAMTHSVTQDGGRTQYNFMHARIHREDTEFLGVDKVDVTRIVGEAIRGTVVAAVDKPKKGSRGPRNGTIVNSIDVTKTYKGKILKLLGAGVGVRVGDPLPDYANKYYDPGVERALGAGETKSPETEDTTPTSKAPTVKAYEVREGFSRRYKERINLPIEEAIKAPWIWSGWSNPEVNETYMQFFGTTSITDIAGVNSKEEDSYFMDTDDAAAILQELAVQNIGVGTSKKKSKSASDQRTKAAVDAGQYQKTVLLMDSERTVENSVDFLVRSYSFVKIAEADVGDFLRSYGWRPIATMVDILGSANLEIVKTTKKVKKVVRQRVLKKNLKIIGGESTTGEPESSSRFVTKTQQSQSIGVAFKPIYGTRFVQRWMDQIGYEVMGKEGFHSRAFGDVADLFGLVSPTVETVLQLDASKRKVAERLDVRKRRREVVRGYVEELMGSRGLLG